MNIENYSLQELIWYQILDIWYNIDMNLDDKIYLCTALSDYMRRL